MHILYYDKRIWNKENTKLIYDILAKVVISKQNSVIALSDDSYIWVSVLLKYIDLAGDCCKTFLLLNKFLMFVIHNKNGIYIESIKTILSTCINLNAYKTWKEITKYLDKENLFFNPIKDWLRGSDNFGENIPGAMGLFDINIIFAWIDKDIENRLPIIARCAPLDLFKYETNIIHSLLVRYGNNKELYQQLHINYANRGWGGKYSDQLKKEIVLARTVLNEETNEFVLTFINDYIETIEARLKKELIVEERFY